MDRCGTLRVRSALGGGQPMAGERVVDFYYSIGSRYSYLASTQIAKLEGETGCGVRWHPVNGPDIRKLRGHDPFVGELPSGQYELAVSALRRRVLGRLLWGRVSRAA